MLPLDLVTASVENLKEAELGQLQSFKAGRIDGQNYELAMLYECIQQVHSESAHADKLVFWSSAGTILAIQRGWQAPWDWDIDLAYESNSQVIGAMMDIWTPWTKSHVETRILALSYSKCKPFRNDFHVDVVREGQLTGRDNKKQIGQIQRICSHKACVDFWQYEPKGDMLCWWVCLNRTDIFPIRMRSVNFFRPSIVGVELYAVKLPSIVHTEAFMRTYPPYRSWREVPYNFYNKTSRQWSFSHEVRRDYLLGVGPQLSLSSIEGIISRMEA